MLVGLSPSATKTSITTQRFNGMPVSIILESTVVLPSIQRNSHDLQNMTDNVQELHKCSGYFHKQRMYGDKNKEAILSDCPV
jgi:hypothetical protein